MRGGRPCTSVAGLYRTRPVATDRIDSARTFEPEHQPRSAGGSSSVIDGPFEPTVHKPPAPVPAPHPALADVGGLGGGCSRRGRFVDRVGPRSRALPLAARARRSRPRLVWASRPRSRGRVAGSGGLAHSRELEEAPATAEERERLLYDDPEPLPAIGGLGVGIGGGLEVPAGLGSGSVRRDEGVLGVGVAGLERRPRVDRRARARRSPGRCAPSRGARDDVERPVAAAAVRPRPRRAARPQPRPARARRAPSAAGTQALDDEVVGLPVPRAVGTRASRARRPPWAPWPRRVSIRVCAARTATRSNTSPLVSRRGAIPSATSIASSNPPASTSASSVFAVSASTISVSPRAFA